MVGILIGTWMEQSFTIIGEPVLIPQNFNSITITHMQVLKKEVFS